MNEEIKKLKEEFDKIDDNKDGMISREELIKCMETLHPHEEAVKKANEIFEEIDFNNDGSINFSELLTVNMKKEKYVMKIYYRKHLSYLTLMEMDL